MNLVTIKLPHDTAEACAKGQASALRRAKAAIASALQQLEEKTKRKIARKRALDLPRPAPKTTGAWATPMLRRVVFDRASSIGGVGRCENGDCTARIYWSSFHLDHFLGKAKAPQKPENCWALCRPCHDKKHAGEPSRAWWLEMFLAFLGHHGFKDSETAREVEGQLQAERAGAELDAMRRQRAEVASG